MTSSFEEKGKSYKNWCFGTFFKAKLTLILYGSTPFFRNLQPDGRRFTPFCGVNPPEGLYLDTFSNPYGIEYGQKDKRL